MSNPYQSHGSQAFESDFESSDPGDTILQRSPIQGEPARESKLSVLGPSLAFKGELVAGEDLLIQGRVEGSIKHTAQNLTIGPEGSVKANIRARAIIVQGTVHGDMYASERVTVEQSAKVRGNIFAPKVGLHEGSTFKGSIDMDVTEEQALADKPATKPVAKKTTRKRSKGRSELGEQEVDKLLK